MLGQLLSGNLLNKLILTTYKGNSLESRYSSMIILRYKIFCSARTKSKVLLVALTCIAAFEKLNLGSFRISSANSGGRMRTSPQSVINLKGSSGNRFLALARISLLSFTKLLFAKVSFCLVVSSTDGQTLVLPVPNSDSGGFASGTTEPLRNFGQEKRIAHGTRVKMKMAT